MPKLGSSFGYPLNELLAKLILHNARRLAVEESIRRLRVDVPKGKDPLPQFVTIPYLDLIG